MVKFEFHVAGQSNKLNLFKCIWVFEIDNLNGIFKRFDAKITERVDNNHWIKITGETDSEKNIIDPDNKDEFYSLEELSKICNVFIEVYTLDEETNYVYHKIYKNGKLDKEKSDTYTIVDVSEDFFDTCEWEEIKKPISPISFDPDWKEEE